MPSGSTQPIHQKKTIRHSLSEEEERVLQNLREPKDKDTLIRLLQLDAQRANALFMQMEIKGLIANDNNHYRAVI